MIKVKGTPLPLGVLLAIKGMKQAADHADKKHPKWTETAYELVKVYASIHKGKVFMAEDLRDWAHGPIGFPEPPDMRAWGGPLKQAAADGLIVFEKSKKTENPVSHSRPGHAWRAM